MSKLRDKLRGWLLGVELRAKTGYPVENLGQCDEVMLHFRDMYISILISAEGETKGEIASLTWSDQPYGQVLIRDIIEVKEKKD